MDIYATFITNHEELSEAFLRIRNQGVPQKFDNKFLSELGFKKPNSVLYVNLFKKLDLIDEDEQPNASYSRFVKSTKASKTVIAELVQKSYAGIFEADKHAHKLVGKELYRLFQKKMGGEKSKTIVKLVAHTFKALVQYADWSKNNNENENQSLESIESKNGNNTIEKADSPHEEFILELMNGESVHDYSNNGSVAIQEKLKEESNGIKKTKATATEEDLEKSRDDRNGTNNGSSTSQNIFLTKALVRRAKLLENLNRKEEAIEAYDDIISYSGNKQYPLTENNVTNAYYKKAAMLEKIDKCEEALRAYDDLIQNYG